MTITRRIALITLGALVIVVGAWYGALWRPAQKHLATLRSEQTVAANNVMTLQAQADALRGEQKQLPKDRVELSQLQAAIPNGPSLDQLIKVIDNAAHQAGVSLTSLATPAPAGWGTNGAASSAATGPGPQDFQVGVGLSGYRPWRAPICYRLGLAATAVRGRLVQSELGTGLDSRRNRRNRRGTGHPRRLHGERDRLLHIGDG